MKSFKLVGNIGLLEGFINGCLYRLRNNNEAIISKEDLGYMNMIIKEIKKLIMEEK